jgi:hypothetical protein
MLSPSFARYRFSTLSAFVALILAGCAAVQVQKQTVTMASYLSEIQYGQVMDNLAIMADNPGALPYYALTQGSRSSIQLSDQTNAGLSWDRLTSAGALLGLLRLDKENVGTTLSRLGITEWDTTPDIDPVQEILMQGLYRKVLGYEIPLYQHAALDNFFLGKPLLAPNEREALRKQLQKTQREAALSPKSQAVIDQMLAALDSYRPEYSFAVGQVYQGLHCGWVHVGKKCDVPREASYVGKHGDTYVWVMQADMASLTSLTIAILDIADTDVSAQSGRALEGIGLAKLKMPLAAPPFMPATPAAPGPKAPDERPARLGVEFGEQAK